MPITAGDVQYMIGADLSGFIKSLNQAEASIRDTAKTLQDEFTKKSSIDDATKKAGELNAAYTTLGAGLSVAGAAITGAFGLATVSAAKFESGLTKLSTLGIKNASDMERIESTVRSLATTYGTDLADGMDGAFTALSLFGNTSEGVSQALVFMEQNAKAATAGYAGFSDIVKTSTSIISAFNLTGNDTSMVLDKVSMAANVSLVDVKDLAGVVGNLAPAFSSAGVSMDEMLASMATATNINQNVSEVSTRMTAMLKGITGPTQNVREQFDELGITWGANALQGTTLHDWLAKLADKTQGNAPALRDLFPDQEAYQGIMLLMGQQTEKLAENTGKVSDSMGAVDEMLQQVMANDPTIQCAAFTNQLKDLSITAGQVLLPALKAITGAVAQMVAGIAEWAKAHPTLTTGIVATTAALGALAVVTGTVLLAITPVAVALASLTTVTGLTVAGLAAFAAPAAAVVAGLAALAYGAYEVYQNWDKWWPIIKETCAGTLKDIVDVVIAGINLIQGNWEEGTKALYEVWDKVWGAIKETAGPALEEIIGYFTVAADFWGGWVDEILGYFSNLKDKAGAIFEEVKAVISAPLDSLKGYLESFGGYLDSIIGHSTWIDYMENLANQSGVHFGQFKTNVQTSLDLTSDTMKEFNATLDSFVMGAEQIGEKLALSGENAVNAANGYKQYTTAVEQGQARIQNQVAHLQAWCDVLGISYSQTGLAITQLQEYMNTTQLTSDELQQCWEKLSEWTAQLEQEEHYLKQGTTAHGDYADSFGDIGLAAESAGSKVTAFYTGVLGGVRQTGITVSENMSDFQDIIDAASAKLGSYGNLMEAFWDQLERSQRKAILGMETRYYTLSEYIREILGITEESLLDAEELTVAYYSSAATAMESMADSANGSLTTIATTATNTARTMSNAANTIASSAKAAITAINSLSNAKAKGYASGGVTDHPLVMVGERGPELAALPVGTRVLSHEDMMTAASMGVSGFASGGVTKEPLYLQNNLQQMKAIWEKRKSSGWLSPMKTEMIDAVLKEHSDSPFQRRFLKQVLQNQPTGGYLATDQGWATWLSAQIMNARPDKSPGESVGGGRGTSSGGGSSTSTSWGGWSPTTGIDLLDKGFSNYLGFANGGVVGMHDYGQDAVQELTNGGLVDSVGGSRSSGNSVSINAPLVSIASVNANSQADVDGLVNKITDTFFRRLSAAGLNLNGV